MEVFGTLMGTLRVTIGKSLVESRYGYPNLRFNITRQYWSGENYNGVRL